MSQTADEIRDVVLHRLKEHGDFPAMAETIVKLNSVTADEDASAGQLASVILEDYALTNKVLRIVNSALFAQSVEVTTISRAIVVLGWKSIQSLVLTLQLFDSLPSGADREFVKEQIGASFLGGVLARNLAGSVAAAHEEEAFICGLFHSFGRTLVTFFLPEKEEEIRHRIQDLKMPEASVVRRVLGGPYALLGRHVAKELNFPTLVLESMNTAPRPRSKKQPTKDEATAGIAALCGAMSRLLVDEAPDAKRRIEELFAAFEESYGSCGVELETFVAQSVEDFESHASAMNLPVAPHKTAKRALRVLGKVTEEEVEAAPPEVVEDLDMASDRVFAEGIREVTASLVSDASLSDILLVVLETMFRGLGASGAARAAFLMRDLGADSLAYRSGIGKQLDDARRWFTVPYADSGVFRIAIDQKKDLYLECLGEADRARALPDALCRRVPADSFVIVLPIVVQGRAIGAFYLDGKGSHPVTPKHLEHLSVLRDQVVLAIRQSSTAAPRACA